MCQVLVLLSRLTVLFPHWTLIQEEIYYQATNLTTVWRSSSYVICYYCYYCHSLHLHVTNQQHSTKSLDICLGICKIYSGKCRKSTIEYKNTFQHFITKCADVHRIMIYMVKEDLPLKKRAVLCFCKCD